MDYSAPIISGQKVWDVTRFCITQANVHAPELAANRALWRVDADVVQRSTQMARFFLIYVYPSWFHCGSTAVDDCSNIALAARERIAFYLISNGHRVARSRCDCAVKLQLF